MVWFPVNVTFQQPKLNASIQSCTPSISVCNFTGLWDNYDPDLVKACGINESVVRVENGPCFRNVFCASCNGFNHTLTEMCPSFNIKPTRVNFTGFLRLSDSIQDYSDSSEKYDSFKEQCRQIVCSEGRELKNGRCEVIFDGTVTMDLDINLLLDPQDPIPLHQAYDIVPTEQCRQMVCSEGRELKKGRCEVIFNGTVTMDLDINLRLDPQDPIPLHQAYDIVPTVEFVVRGEILNKVGPTQICGIEVLLQYNLLSNQTTNRNRLSDTSGEVTNKTIASYLLFYFLRIRISVKDYLEKTVESLKSLNGAFISLNGTEMAKLHVKKPLPVFLMKLVHDTNKWKFDMITSVMNSTFKEKKIKNGVIDIYYTASQINSVSLFNDTDNMLQIPYLHLNNQSDEYCRQEEPRYPLLSLKSCPMFKFKLPLDLKRKVNGYEEEDTLTRLFGEDYTIVMKSQSAYILICVDTYLEKLKQLKPSPKDRGLDPTLLVIARICTCASIICSIFSLVTYCIFKQLRTLQGKNNIALIVSTIFWQVLSLVEGIPKCARNLETYETICLAMYFFQLVSLFWMNICVFHVCQVLLKIGNISNRGNCRRYSYYHLYCSCMALVFFSIEVGIVYGKFIDDVSTQRTVKETIAYFPLVVVMVLNFSMYLAVVISLKRRPLIGENMKNDRICFVVFIKISTVTGITWIFDFFNWLTDIHEFLVLAIISHSSVGIFIMLAFICNKRILTLYKTLLRHRNGSADRSMRMINIV